MLQEQIELPYQFDFRAYQEDIWFDERKNKVLVIHRRAGKTSLAVNKLIYEAILNPGKVYFYIAPTIRQAKDIVWKAPNMLSQYLPMVAVEKKNEVELTIYFKNGAQIHVKGADNPDSLRGMNPFGVVIDEYAQIKKELYDEIIAPVLAENGGWVWFIGTPKGKNHFYEKYSMAFANPSWQAVILRSKDSKIIPQEILDELKKNGMSQRTYEQELECMFHDTEGVVFRRVKENVEDCLNAPISDHQYAIGVDLARLQDFTSIDVLDRHTWKIVYRERFNQIDWNLQKARIESVARRYNNARLKIDSTGVGDPIVQDLQKIGLAVEPVRFTNVIKREMIETLIIALEQDKLKIPNDPVLIDELVSFTCDINERTGTVYYSAPQGLHDDCVISLALALYKEEKLHRPAPSASRKTMVNISYDKFGRQIIS